MRLACLLLAAACLTTPARAEEKKPGARDIDKQLFDVLKDVHNRGADLFNAGEYWLAHEALETVWRSIISDGDAAAARVWQGLIQAAAALLHQQRGNSHGVATVGRGALEKLAGRQRPDVEVETVRFRAQLERALAGDAEPPRLELRGADGELRTDEGNR